MSDLTKPTDPSFTLTKGKLSSKTSGFKARIEAAKHNSNIVDPQTMPNRICLMLDCSGSMHSYEGDYHSATSKSRIDLLKEAVQNFVSRCNFADTSVAVACFPHLSVGTLPLTSDSSCIIEYSVGLEPSGGTPLYSCLVNSIEDVAMTRGVVVSDGGATDWAEPTEEQAIESTRGKILQIYKSQGIPLDCVHISSSTEGEELLRRIAAETGGIFMKFSDVNAFSRAFGYLTPTYRALLSSGNVSAKELGAKEIK